MRLYTGGNLGNEGAGVVAIEQPAAKEAKL